MIALETPAAYLPALLSRVNLSIRPNSCRINEELKYNGAIDPTTICHCQRASP